MAKLSASQSRSRKSADKREAVLRVLHQSDRPLTAYQILARLRGDSIKAPTTVYRLLEQLIGEGEIHRIESINSFVACDKSCHSDRKKAVFSICEECGKTCEFADDQILAILLRQAQMLNFELHSTTLEMRGRCASCAGKA
ncbi:MAG: Fur family transcriptional regulator [Betaproteobacteria bacterium]|nr:Fur family transcriptional regulator [Betaproteobacteria bacterium]